MRRRPACVLVLIALFGALGLSGASAALGAPMWLRPVPGRVVRPFQAPLSRYGRGHEGVDLAAAPGTPVRAAGPGIVVFAGVVAGARHVVVRHPNGMRTSYSFLAGITVRRGEAVTRGEVLGTTGGRGEHHDGAVLHLGLRIGATFVDPMQLFTGEGLAVVVHLVDDPSPGPAARESAAAESRVLQTSLARPGETLPRAVIDPAGWARSATVPVCDHLGAAEPAP